MTHNTSLFFLMQTCLPLTFTAFLFSSFSHCSPSSFLPLYFLLHISIHHPLPLSLPLPLSINFPPSSFFMCCCIGLSLHSSILLKLSTQKTWLPPPSSPWLSSVHHTLSESHFCSSLSWLDTAQKTSQSPDCWLQIYTKTESHLVLFNAHAHH